MQKNDLIERNGIIYRILDLSVDSALIIDCINRQMPKWIDINSISDYRFVSVELLQEKTNFNFYDIESAPAAVRRTIRERFTLIAGILPFISNEKERSQAITRISEQYEISKVTIRRYLCLYLAFHDMSALAQNSRAVQKPLTPDEKNMRWALNKFYYTKRQNSLNTSYTYMLKEKYCDSSGQLVNNYPSFHQFRNFYRKTKNFQKYYITRGGLKDYQKNYRPLLGDNVQEFAPIVGTGMLDSTICDIYLVNEAGGVVGRPILTVCIDAYSSMCMGYSLSWEGGMYSIVDLMINVLADKVQFARERGVAIDKSMWDCCGILPSTFVTDMGREYTSYNFEQITELGIRIINLPAFRPELKGPVEKFFDLVQNSFKAVIYGKGIIESDFQMRGGHDYRKDACLTMKEFEKIVLRCIIHYNTKRIIEKFPYTEEMLTAGISPFANTIWNYCREQIGANLIPVSISSLQKVLLPRTIGKFTREGLRVNSLRYKNDKYTEQYISGGQANVAFNPSDLSTVWLIDNGEFVTFDLIEKRFSGKTMNEAQAIQARQKEIVKSFEKEALQSKIELFRQIETISEVGAVKTDNVDIQQIRKNRKKEKLETHKDFLKGV